MIFIVMTKKQSYLINILDISYYYHLVVFVLNNKNSGIVVICHEDMTGKRGGKNVVGISMFPITVVLIFWWENPSLLDYDDIIMLHC